MINKENLKVAEMFFDASTKKGGMLRRPDNYWPYFEKTQRRYKPFCLAPSSLIPTFVLNLN